jgi:hypothetical protein
LDGQSLPQPPQCASLLLVSTQLELQKLSPFWHWQLSDVQVHEPFSHVEPGPH